MSSKQTKPNAQDNDDDDGVAPEPPARGAFADIFRASLGENTDEVEMSSNPEQKPDHDNGLPDSPDSITQSRAPHGKEAAGMSRYVTE